MSEVKTFTKIKPNLNMMLTLSFHVHQEIKVLDIVYNKIELKSMSWGKGTL
jgi:hypothetical protein